jgi:hypothetical protein
LLPDSRLLIFKSWLTILSHAGGIGNGRATDLIPAALQPASKKARFG